MCSQTVNICKSLWVFNRDNSSFRLQPFQAPSVSPPARVERRVALRLESPFGALPRAIWTYRFWRRLFGWRPRPNCPNDCRCRCCEKHRPTNVMFTTDKTVAFYMFAFSLNGEFAKFVPHEGRGEMLKLLLCFLRLSNILSQGVVWYVNGDSLSRFWVLVSGPLK